MKKSETAAVPAEAAVSGGRPQRLLKKSELPPVEPGQAAAAEVLPGRPPRLLKKAELDATAESVPPAEPSGLEVARAAEPAPVEPLPIVEPPAVEPGAAPEAPASPPGPVASTADEVAESPAPKSPARLSRMKKPAERPSSGTGSSAREGHAAPASTPPGAEGRERKYVAKPKAAAESGGPAKGEPGSVGDNAAHKTSQDKISAVQSGKKKLRGIRINPDLE
jgi:ribonuclease E